MIASSPVQAHEPIIIRIQDCHVLRSSPAVELLNRSTS